MTRVRGRMNNAFDPASAEAARSARRASWWRRGASGSDPPTGSSTRTRCTSCAGAGTRLDADGHEYLDAYNNVVSVGHAHPRVVAAVAEQMGTLCTHTRYLHEGIVATPASSWRPFGGEVGAGHAMFTCTGSEANDLALRIAKHRTGRDGVIVTDEAYHGTTDPDGGDLAVPGRRARRRHRGRARCALDRPCAEAVRAPRRGSAPPRQRLRRAARRLRLQLRRPLPARRRPARRRGRAVRAAGGVFIADEVQRGFGRLGDGLWGFARHGVEPDIVTLGKPMGNGFPVAGLAVPARRLADFGHDVRYFNTFGGNPWPSPPRRRCST